MQESQNIARKNLLKAKNKSKEKYDRTSYHQNIEVGNKVLLQDKTSKNKSLDKTIRSFTGGPCK